MIESLVILTTIFGAYIVHTIINDGKSSAPSQDLEPQTPISEPPPPAETATETALTETAEQSDAEAPSTQAEDAGEQATVEDTTAQAGDANKQAASEDNSARAEEGQASDTAKHGLKNPKTGEVVINYNNYRFLKRWIKEALVTEGLLGKIYKNNELDAATEAKIKEALAKLESIDKYKA